jgi:phosphoglycolate phosphatase
MMNKIVIWDFNGTILDDFAIGLQALNQMLGRRGLPAVSASAYLDHFDFPVKNFYRRVGFDFSREPFADLAAEYMAIYQPASFNCRLKPGARESLSRLQAHGIGQVLLSATRHDFLVRQIRHFGLESYFSEILGMNDLFGRSKLELACGWLGENGRAASDLLLVGDTIHDFVVAEALRCSCVLVAGGHNAKTRLIATGARVLDDLAGLPAMVIEI